MATMSQLKAVRRTGTHLILDFTDRPGSPIMLQRSTPCAAASITESLVITGAITSAERQRILEQLNPAGIK